MASPKETDVMSWLTREEINIRDPLTITKLQLKLSGATNPSLKSYYQHILNMAGYQINVLQPLGVTTYVHPENLFRTVGFGVVGKPGFYNWDSIKAMFNLRGPRKTGEFD